jgi:hypothetical protein
VFERGAEENIWTQKGGSNRRLEKKRLKEELHEVYCSLNIIKVMKSRRMRWAGHITCMGGMRNACKIFVGKLKWKRPLTRPRHRWDDDIKVDRREID